MHRLHAYSLDPLVLDHTYGRNSNIVALSSFYMDGIPDPWAQPPTPAQLTRHFTEATAIATVLHVDAHPACHQYEPYAPHPMPVRAVGPQGSAVSGRLSGPRPLGQFALT